VQGLAGFELDPSAVISADDLINFRSLKRTPKRLKTCKCVIKHGITLYQGDAFAAYGLAILIKHFESMGQPSSLGYLGALVTQVLRLHNVILLSLRATITVSIIATGLVAWPKRKLKEWYRLGAGC